MARRKPPEISADRARSICAWYKLSGSVEKTFQQTKAYWPNSYPTRAQVRAILDDACLLRDTGKRKPEPPAKPAKPKRKEPTKAAIKAERDELRERLSDALRSLEFQSISCESWRSQVHDLRAKWTASKRAAWEHRLAVDARWLKVYNALQLSARDLDEELEDTLRSLFEAREEIRRLADLLAEQEQDTAASQIVVGYLEGRLEHHLTERGKELGYIGSAGATGVNLDRLERKLDAGLDGIAERLDQFERQPLHIIPSQHYHAGIGWVDNEDCELPHDGDLVTVVAGPDSPPKCCGFPMQLLVGDAEDCGHAWKDSSGDCYHCGQPAPESATLWDGD